MFHFSCLRNEGKFLSNSRVASKMRTMVQNLNKRASHKRLLYFQDTLVDTKNKIIFQRQGQNNS